MKLYLDPGHGGKDSGAEGNGLQEKDIVLDIALNIHDILTREYKNIQVKMSRTTDKFVSLDQRTNEANLWGADYFLSIHCNSSNGSGYGYEDYIHDSLSNSSKTGKYRDIIHKEVIAVNELHDRGEKKADFYVLRESTMPALLTENGFIDNDHDAQLMKRSDWRKKVARGHVNGLEKAFNLEQNNTVNEKIYKVIAGSFRDKKNAEKRVNELHSKGIDAFIDPAVISGELWYRVQAGAFIDEKNAEKRLWEIEALGIKDAFIAAEDVSIQGPVYLTADEMDQYVKSVNSEALSLGNYYAAFGQYYNIKGDIAFAQSLLETNYFRFTGVVKKDQNNFAGIGATGPDNPGASFNTPRDGVLAHMQHLYAYATTNPLPAKYPLVDPRFDHVERGTAPNWVDLNGKWAVPGDNYGQSILNLYRKMKQFSKESSQNYAKN
ncbi:N-acetylmuramoyl-L-alanine amidase [Scopulibacillus cellulosilyticus]|uniref:N-acetylmuramoyl-L-alanine amidase n=1 Tax=Scopulibacillus cellulosilyticus TaxID=2665665 RepID=A0ABW2PYY2_9BACL